MGGVGVNHHLLPPLPSLKEGGRNAYCLHLNKLHVNGGILANNYGERNGVVAVFCIGVRGVELGGGGAAIAKIPNAVAALGKVGVLAEVGKLYCAAKIIVGELRLRIGLYPKAYGAGEGGGIVANYGLQRNGVDAGGLVGVGKGLCIGRTGCVTLPANIGRAGIAPLPYVVAAVYTIGIGVLALVGKQKATGESGVLGYGVCCLWLCE